MKSIYLIGFMGAGKTTVGKALAAQLNCAYVDTDEEIVKQSGRSIATIFSEEGEANFRRWEQRVLAEIATTNTVVSTGGGIVTTPECVQWMRENGLIVFLHTTMDVILERIKGDDTRPLTTEGEEALRQRYEARRSLYQCAHISIDTADKTIAEIVFEISNNMTS